MQDFALLLVDIMCVTHQPQTVAIVVIAAVGVGVGEGVVALFIAVKKHHLILMRLEFIGGDLR